MLSKVPREFDTLFGLLRIYQQHVADLETYIRGKSTTYYKEDRIINPEYEESLRKIVNDDKIRIGQYITNNIPELFTWLGYRKIG